MRGTALLPPGWAAGSAGRARRDRRGEAFEGLPSHRASRRSAGRGHRSQREVHARGPLPARRSSRAPSSSGNASRRRPLLPRRGQPGTARGPRGPVRAAARQARHEGRSDRQQRSHRRACSPRRADGPRPRRQRSRTTQNAIWPSRSSSGCPARHVTRKATTAADAAAPRGAAAAQRLARAAIHALRRTSAIITSQAAQRRQTRFGRELQEVVVRVLLGRDRLSGYGA